MLINNLIGRLVQISPNVSNFYKDDIFIIDDIQKSYANLLKYNNNDEINVYVITHIKDLILK